MSWQVTGSFIGGPLCLLAFIMMLLKHKPKIQIKDKIVLITGATSGLGKACAVKFVKAGCRVILAGRSIEKLKEVQKELIDTIKSEFTPEIVVLDLEDDQSILTAIETAYSFYNKIDILINNAGVSYRGTIQDTEIDVHRKIMQVNYFGQLILTKGIVSRMKKDGGGHIVGISSIQGIISIPYRSAYSASKHAFQAFCDCVRAEYCDDKIRVSVISPGYMQTNLSLNAMTSDGSQYGVMDKTTESGMKPEYVAQQVLNAIIYDKNEVKLASLGPKLGCFLRTLAPNVFFWKMNSRAREQK
ncbi:hypothetical protein LOTGIDRAFT_212002 [Lottia gigantea]|uniref:Dehydrogenase/reductase SDR family protein 7-like n=1 Tax=Lottia gigantea TaxID=225164 RepID=V4CNB1_LOTGI|nr:hypothetical protein LOTGIDRAFT_212002 [Lottia gigantea]ESP03855.1 hypothetical protein LOTGIDRAFT_212002 [Lottia gigantea]